MCCQQLRFLIQGEGAEHQELDLPALLITGHNIDDYPPEVADCTLQGSKC
jgi:hypothetical protein